VTRRRPLGIAISLLGLLGLGLLVFEVRLPGPFGSGSRIALHHAALGLTYRLLPEAANIEAFPSPGPNIVLVVLDCFRSDYIQVSPELDRLRSSSWWFERHYASATWTKPSTASLFTGVLPRRHTVGGGDSALPEAAETLAEQLQRAGFATAGFVRNGHLGPEQRFDQGFDHYSDTRQVGSKALIRGFSAWLNEAKPKRFFAYLHFLGTHHPDSQDTDLLPLLRAPRYGDPVSFFSGTYVSRANRGEVALTDAALDNLRFAARNKAGRVDREAVGRLVRLLSESTLLDNTLLVFTSDHGDAFMEHGRLGHGGLPHEAVTRIPLVVRLPGTTAGSREVRSAGRVECLTSTVDLLPTILEFAGVPLRGASDGDSLLGFMDGSASCARDVVSEHTGLGRIRGAALWHDRFKILVDYSTGRSQLFDLRSDPMERIDRTPSMPEMASSLKSTLEARLNADGALMPRWSPSRQREALPPATLEELEALGYLD
jgi:arylsulfatase